YQQVCHPEQIPRSVILSSVKRIAKRSLYGAKDPCNSYASPAAARYFHHTPGTPDQLPKNSPQESSAAPFQFRPLGNIRARSPVYEQSLRKICETEATFH